MKRTRASAAESPSARTRPRKDAVEDEEGASSSAMAKQSVAGRVTPFVRTLWKIMNTPAYSDIISWGPNGNSFVVHDQNRLENEVIKSNFNARSFASFLKNLNNHRFYRCSGVESREWAHEGGCFLRGRADLLADVKRPKAGTARAGGQDDDEEEEDGNGNGNGMQAPSGLLSPAAGHPHHSPAHSPDVGMGVGHMDGAAGPGVAAGPQHALRDDGQLGSCRQALADVTAVALAARARAESHASALAPLLRVLVEQLGQNGTRFVLSEDTATETITCDLISGSGPDAKVLHQFNVEYLPPELLQEARAAAQSSSAVPGASSSSAGTSSVPSVPFGVLQRILLPDLQSWPTVDAGYLVSRPFGADKLRDIGVTEGGRDAVTGQLRQWQATHDHGAHSLSGAGAASAPDIPLTSSILGLQGALAVAPVPSFAPDAKLVNGQLYHVHGGVPRQIVNGYDHSMPVNGYDSLLPLIQQGTSGATASGLGVPLLRQESPQGPMARGTGAAGPAGPAGPDLLDSLSLAAATEHGRQGKGKLVTVQGPRVGEAGAMAANGPGLLQVSSHLPSPDILPLQSLGAASSSLGVPTAGGSIGLSLGLGLGMGFGMGRSPSAGVGAGSSIGGHGSATASASRTIRSSWDTAAAAHSGASADGQLPSPTRSGQAMARQSLGSITRQDGAPAGPSASLGGGHGSPASAGPTIPSGTGMPRQHSVGLPLSRVDSVGGVYAFHAGSGGFNSVGPAGHGHGGHQGSASRALQTLPGFPSLSTGLVQL